MSYDPSQPTDKDKVRLLIGDTSSDEEILTDGEINFFLDQEANIYLAASMAAMACAAKFAPDTDFRFSTLWQDASQAYKHFKQLSVDLKEKAAEKVGTPEFVAPLSGNQTAQGDPQFTVGMHDHLNENR